MPAGFWTPQVSISKPGAQSLHCLSALTAASRPFSARTGPCALATRPGRCPLRAAFRKAAGLCARPSRGLTLAAKSWFRLPTRPGPTFRPSLFTPRPESFPLRSRLAAGPCPTGTRLAGARRKGPCQAALRTERPYPTGALTLWPRAFRTCAARAVKGRPTRAWPVLTGPVCRWPALSRSILCGPVWSGPIRTRSVDLGPLSPFKALNRFNL